MSDLEDRQDRPWEQPRDVTRMDSSSTTTVFDHTAAFRRNGEQEIKQDEFLVTFAPDDSENPQNWSNTRKWSILAFLCLVEILVSALSSAYSSGIIGIESEYGIREQVALLGQSMYVVGFAFAPLFLGPLSEVYGRQFIYAASLFVLTIMQIPAAYSHNTQALIATRFFAGCAGSVPLTNTGGSIADLFERSRAGYAVSLFAFAGIAGPPLGPVLAGFINVTKGWRWIFWTFMILIGACFVAQVVLIPETKHNTILMKRAKKLRKSRGDERYHAEGEDNINPFILVGHLLRDSAYMLVTEPIIATLGLYNAYLYGIVFIFFEAYPLVFGTNHGWNTGEIGLAFLGIVVGAFIALFIYPVFETRYRNRKSSTPETRLEGSLYTGFLLPVGLFWFAWTSKTQIHPLAPVFSGIPFGIGAFYIYFGVVNYVTDSYGANSASALAAISFVRSSFGAGATHIAPPMYSYLGYTWATATLGFIHRTTSSHNSLDGEFLWTKITSNFKSSLVKCHK